MQLSSLGIRKLTLLLILVLLFPLLGHLWYSGYAHRKDALAYTELQVEQSIRLFSAKQQQLVEETRHTLAMMAHLPGVPDLKGASCNQALKRIHDDMPHYSTLVVAASSGIIECCSLPLQEPLVVRDRDWFKRSLETQSFVVGNYIISRSSGKASLPFAYPVLDQQGNTQFIIGAALNLAAFDTLFAELSLPDKSNILIVDRNGTILYSSLSGNTLTGKDISTILPSVRPEKNKQGLIEGLPENPDTLYWMHRVTVGHEHNDIYVLVGIPKVAVFAKVNQATVVYLLFLAAIFLLAASLSLYLGRRYIIEPLQALVRRTAAVAAGELFAENDLPAFSGEVGLLATAFNDMTQQLAERNRDRQKAEQALRESEQRYRALFEQNPLSLWVQDFSILREYLAKLRDSGQSDLQKYFHDNPELISRCLAMVKALHVNKATCELYGASGEEDLLLSLDKLIPSSSRQLMVAEFVAIAEGRPFTVEVENQTLDGRVFPALVHSSIPYGYEESWAKVFVSVLDLSERYEFERKQNELQQQLVVAQKLETVGTLAGGIAHDFNNILAPIIGYAELGLTDQKLTPVTRSYLERILTGAHRAKEMVHQILAFSSRKETSKRSVDLGKLTEEALGLLRSSIPSTIEIKSEIEPGLMPIFANAVRIHQIIMNLCTNSYQAMKERGGVIILSVREGERTASHQGVRSVPHVLLTIKDTGQGISEENLAKIFEPFFTTKPIGEGSGMGLSVVHGIVKEHGGEIEVKSTVDEGTSFNVYLPCAKEYQPDEVAANTELPKGNHEQIMVLDDEGQLLEMVCDLLRSLGYKVHEFTNPLAAIAAFREAPMAFDLLLTDQTMPVMTGVQVTREILAIRKNLPVVLYTGFSETVSPESAKAQGVKAFLYKPVTSQELADTIRQALDHREN